MGDSSLCSPATGIKWKFAEPLGSCIYNTYDEIAFIMGWMSVSIWSVAMLPQIITNCKKKSAENQSFWFWILWLVGDAINFIGCILTKNIITNTALAFVYFVFTLVACAQFILFEFVTKKYKKQKNHPSDTGITTNMSSTLLQIQSNQQNSPNLRPIIDESASSFSNRFWSTPRFAAKYNHQTPSSTNEMTPKLKSSLAFLARSPRIFAISPQLTSQCKNEYEILNASSSKSVKAMNDESDIVIAGKSSTTIIGALSSMSVTIVMLYGLQSVNYDQEMNGSDIMNERVLLHTKDDNGSNEDILLLLGLMFGWISTFIYIASRFPQLRIMVKSKDVSGINPLFFVLTCSGNLTQVLSMLINEQMYTDSSQFVSKAPWLIGSSVCMLQDAFILFLIYLFRKREKKTDQFLLDDSCHS